MSGPADVTSGVQKKYLTVKTADFNLNTRPDDYNYVDIEFPEPLQHVHEIALQTAVIPNEFFNVRDGQNQLTLAWLNFDTSMTRAITVTVTPGLYTLDKLCIALTDELANRQADLLHPTSVIEITREASSFATNLKVTQLADTVQVDIAPGNLDADQGYYALVHHATEQCPFGNSIPARLGFTRQDVFTVYTAPLNSGTVAGDDSWWINRPDEFTLDKLQEMRLRPTSVFEAYTTQTAANDNITESMLSGFETYDTVMLHCDLLSNSTMITGHLETGVHPAPTTVMRSDVLAVLPNNANIGSSILYVRPSEHFGGHAINQHRPITKMRLWLTDNAGKPFKHYEMADYVAVIEFTIVEHVPDIMRQVAQLNQNKSFQSRHMPMMLG